MKLQIKTDVLKEMVSKAVQGASQNKLAPLTNMMAIELKSGKLTLHTTDTSNHLYIMQNNVSGDDFYVTVFAEQFSKLIGKLTCENVSMELKDNSLEVKGNGKYEIELPLDEDGALVKFPDPYSKNMTAPITNTIKLSTIHTILNTAKASLATNQDTPCYKGYYVGDSVLATDTYKICSITTSLLDEPVLISPEMMDLLNVITCENIDVSITDDVIQFVTTDVVVYGHKMEGLDEYAVDAINGLLNTEFVSKCKVAKDALLASLDRIALFVGTYDNKAIRLDFTENGIEISSKKSNGVETVDYKEVEDFKSQFTCLIDIDMLTTQIKANNDSTIEIHYGNDKFVSIVSDNITQIIALLEEDEE